MKIYELFNTGISVGHYKTLDRIINVIKDNAIRMDMKFIIDESYTRDDYVAKYKLVHQLGGTIDYNVLEHELK